MIKVSIIIPVYNVKEYFDFCMQSIVDQTYSNIEIIIVDDGSNDGTQYLCDQWANKDNRIVVFHKENEGTHSARNLGLEKASGDYVSFIDPDDWLDKNTVETCVCEIEKNQLDVVRFNYIKEFNNSSEKRNNTLLQEKVYTGEDCTTIQRQILGLINEEKKHPENLNFLASVCFAFYKKYTIDKFNIRFKSLKEIGSFEDGLFNFEYFFHVKKFKFLNKYFYHYRKTNTQSATSNYRENFLQKQLLLFSILKNLIDNNNMDERFLVAYNNRVALSSMELCFNVFKRESTFISKYNEIKQIIKNDIYLQALKQFSLRNLPIKWMSFYFFVKTKSSIGVCIMCRLMKIIRRIK